MKFLTSKLFILFLIAFLLFTLLIRVLYKITKRKIFKVVMQYLAAWKFKLPWDGKITKLTTTNSLLFLFTLLSFLFLILISGYLRAKDFSYIYMRINGSNYLVISKYEDKFLIMPVDIKTGIVKRQLQTVDIEDLTIGKYTMILKPIKISKLSD